VTYLSFRTAAGHTLTIKANRQKSLFWLINDALLAEPRLDEKQLSYRNYRRKRGLVAIGESEIRMSWSARKDLDRITDALFRELDAGILRLASRPNAPSSKSKALRWFRGDLRRVVVEPFPIFYIVTADHLVRILRIGFPRWDRVSKVLGKIIRKYPATRN
jgi:hypothetical protein